MRAGVMRRIAEAEAALEAASEQAGEVGHARHLLPPKLAGLLTEPLW
jgi:hypothetical protein